MTQVLEQFDPSAAASPDAGLFGMSCDPTNAGYVMVPVPYEGTVSYRTGTAAGPEAIKRASHQVDLFDPSGRRPYRDGIAMLETDPRIIALNSEVRALVAPILLAGGVGLHQAANPLKARAEQANALGEILNTWLYSTVLELLSSGQAVGVVGGEHSVAFGSIRALAANYPGMGLLQIDAHADLRVAYEGLTFSHASIMANVLERIPAVSTLVQVGIRDLCEEEWQLAQNSQGRVYQHLEVDVRQRMASGVPWMALVQEMLAPLPEDVYLSVDIDGLEPSLCPHTGTPVPGGLSYAEAMILLDAVIASGRRVVGFDLCEVSPGPEGDEWDGNVGARVLYKLITLMAASRR